MKMVEAAIYKWSYDPKPDIREVTAAIYRVRAFNHMLRALGTKPRRKKRR